MRKPLKLQTRFTLLVIIVVLISLSIVITFTTSWMTRNIEDEVRTNIINVANMTAHSKEIITELKKKDPNKKIGPYVDSLLTSLNQIQFIVIADMEDTRYSHPDVEKIGKKVMGGDEERVIDKGESYTSEARGTLGRSMRALTPIYDENNKQIGFVIVGTLIENIEKSKALALQFFLLMGALGLVIGILGAVLLANSIKKSLLGLEPQEISRLYNEKISIMDALHEGLIAIDDDSKITMINDSAVKIMHLEDKHSKSELIGQHVEEVIPTTRLQGVMETGISEYDKEQNINDTVIMTNRVPIKDNGKIKGAIATFRDKTELTRLAEELTGVKQIVDALRANNHEFMNKLHAILGLLFMDEVEEAKKYITTITNKQQKLVDFISSKVKDPTIAGLILGKFSRANEMDIDFKIDEASWLKKYHSNINSSTLLAIIGNLIENAMEAVNRGSKNNKYVYMRIEENETSIEIEVEDSGIGIKEENLEKIFQRGYTTKPGSGGVGLDIVKEAVENLGGTIQVNSEVNEGTIFSVYLPKKLSKDSM